MERINSIVSLTRELPLRERMEKKLCASSNGVSDPVRCRSLGIGCSAAEINECHRGRHALNCALKGDSEDY